LEQIITDISSISYKYL